MKAKRNPTRAPTNSDGAKVLPTPPAPLVAEVAKALEHRYRSDEHGDEPHVFAVYIE